MAMQTATSDEVARALPQYTARLNRLLWRHVGADLSRTEAAVLSTLSGGRRRITELAEFEGLAQPTVTVLVGRLEARGLVSRERDASDGRAVLVDITDDGRAVLDRIRGQMRDLVERRMASMSSKEVAALRAATDTLGTLIDALQREE